MDRITVLDDDLWSVVPAEVLEKAMKAASQQPCWIAMREDGHFVSYDAPPGGPDTATGDLVYIAEVGPPDSVHELGGQAKEAAGRFTGVGRDAGDGLQALSQTIRDQPLTAMVIAFGIGWLLGRLRLV